MYKAMISNNHSKECYVCQRNLLEWLLFIGEKRNLIILFFFLSPVELLSMRQTDESKKTLDFFSLVSFRSFAGIITL